MVDMQLVVLPGLQRLVDSGVARHRGVGEDGASAGKRHVFTGTRTSNI